MLIAQISDFHLKSEGTLAYGVADTATPLKRTIEHINRLNPMPDLILVTGDLVDGGGPDTYAYLSELLSLLRPPLVIVPGNHDHKASLRKAFPEHDYLHRRPGREGRKLYLLHFGELSCSPDRPRYRHPG